jgi:O-antigen ligase
MVLNRERDAERSGLLDWSTAPEMHGTAARPWLVSGVFVLSLLSGVAIAQSPVLSLAATVVGIIALLLFRYPELGLAMLLNGQAAYFFILDRVGVRPFSVLTAAVFGILVLPSTAALMSRRGGLRIRTIDLLFAALVAWMLMSYLLLSLGQEWPMRKLSFAPFLMIVPYAAGRLFREPEWDRFESWVLRISKILAVVFGYELLRSSVDVARFSPFSFGPQGTEGNPILVGMTFAIPLLLIYVSMMEGRMKVTLPSLAWIGLFAYLCISSGARGPVASLVTAIVVYHIVRRANPRQLLVAALFVSAAGLALLRVPTSVYDFFGRTLIIDPAGSTFVRLSFWAEAAREFTASPLLGQGFGNFSPPVIPAATGQGPDFPHNILLETASELGLVGFGLLVAILLMTVARAKTLLATEGSQRLSHSLVLFVFALAEAQVSGFLTGQTYLFLSLGILWGTMTSGSREGIHGQSRARPDPPQPHYSI